jgi:light-regulated signal transduction histidine kinase (bacteriophytochrome)
MLHELPEASRADLIERLDQAAAELAIEKAATAELESFRHAVAHDLIAPLRHIAAYAGRLKQEQQTGDPAAMGTLIDRIVERAAYMGELVAALQRLAGVSREPLRAEALDLSAMAADVVAELREESPQRAVEVQIQPGLASKGDPALVRILLENLLGNAWKFSARAPAARIEVGRDPDSVPTSFFVRDNGVGFDPRYATRLFGAFQRLHPPRDFEGAGMGLATARRIVSRHGGRIGGEGQAGLGATFHFTLSPDPRSVGTPESGAAS